MTQHTLATDPMTTAQIARTGGAERWQLLEAEIAALKAGKTQATGAPAV